MEKHFLSSLFFVLTIGFAQQSKDTLQVKQLEEVVISSSRIALPLQENTRSIEVVSKEMIQATGLTTVVDILQLIAGVDIRRRGIAGMQADLYIRGGSFDQTLLLVDGIKLDDAQTGHHTLNFALPLEVIERIEIIKGPAARVFGQNAFTGAINIVTKNELSSNRTIELNTGSYEQYTGKATLGATVKETSVIAHYSYNESEGYRYNTDFQNNNAFVKARFNQATTPIQFLATFSDRKFGANGFYASPSNTDQYEETQASLLALSSTIEKDDWQIKPRLYWRRGQDEYIFIRNNPSIYRNLHITHKVGLSLDANRQSNLGTTGVGIDLSRISISSNNLGDRDRFVSTLFLEHRFVLLNEKLSLTPGIAVTNYTDFGTQFFPGVDLGYALSEKVQWYGNIGYTYRIPTFTDLYYSDPSTLGNENLKVEEALTEEIGIRYVHHKFKGSVAIFNRDASNLIDYVRQTEEARFEATNIRKVNTFGVEFTASQRFNFGAFPQSVSLGYTYLEDDVKQANVNFSRYSINSLKHHLTLNYQGTIAKNLTTSIAYKLGQRTHLPSYEVIDLNLQWQLKQFRLSLSANNILNEHYSESNLVPMPLGNGLFGVAFTF